MYINEEADYNDENRYPVFIVLTYGNNPLGMAIKHFTGDEWTHSLISFNPELSPMYSFAARTQKIKGPHSLFGYTYQGTTDNWYKHKQTKYLVYVMYVNKFAIKKMKDHVNYFTSHEKDFKYDFIGLANIARNKDSETHRKYFCSRFVAEVIGQGVPLGKLPSLYRPQELKDLNNISLVNAGTDMYMYNPKVTISNLKKVKNKIYNKFNYQEKYIEKEDENMNDYLDLYLDYIVEESRNDSISNTRKQHIDEVKKTIDDSKKTQKMIKKAIVLCLACIGLGIWLANNHVNKKMYQQQVGNLKEKLNELQDDNNDLKRKVGNLTRAVNKLNTQLNDTNSRVDDLESKTKRAYSRLNKIDGPEGQLAELRAENKSTREVLKKTGKRVGQIVGELEKQKKEYEKDKERYTKQIGNITEHIKKQDNAIKATGQKVSKAQKDSLGAAAMNLLAAKINSDSKDKSERRALTTSKNRQKKPLIIDVK